MRLSEISLLLNPNHSSLWCYGVMPLCRFAVLKSQAEQHLFDFDILKEWLAPSFVMSVVAPLSIDALYFIL
jgi:hypothetical protein